MHIPAQRNDMVHETTQRNAMDQESQPVTTVKTAQTELFEGLHFRIKLQVYVTSILSGLGIITCLLLFSLPHVNGLGFMSMPFTSTVIALFSQRMFMSARTTFFLSMQVSRYLKENHEELELAQTHRRIRDYLNSVDLYNWFYI